MLPTLCYIMPNNFKYITFNYQLFMVKITIVIPMEVKYKKSTHAGGAQNPNRKYWLPSMA